MRTDKDLEDGNYGDESGFVHVGSLVNIAKHNAGREWPDLQIFENAGYAEGHGFSPSWSEWHDLLSTATQLSPEHVTDVLSAHLAVHDANVPPTYIRWSPLEIGFPNLVKSLI